MTMRTNFVTAMSIVLSCMAFSSCAQTTTFSIGGKTTGDNNDRQNDKDRHQTIQRQEFRRYIDLFSDRHRICAGASESNCHCPGKDNVAAGCFRQEFHPSPSASPKRIWDILKRTHTAEGYRILSGAETDHLFRLCRHFSLKDAYSPGLLRLQFREAATSRQRIYMQPMPHSHRPAAVTSTSIR